MLVDFVRLVQDLYIPEDKSDYWEKAETEICEYIDKYTTVDRLFVEFVGDAFHRYLDVKNKASNLHEGDMFEMWKRVYEVVKGTQGNSARFVRGIDEVRRDIK